ncbi:MAG: TonB-dependent receptor domain-containing protein, partial [Flavobacteriaceae bacterium]
SDWDDPNSPKTFANNLSNGDSHRYYQNLFEDELGYRAKLVYDLQNREDEENNTKLSLGFVGRKKTVDFDATQINHAPRRNIAQPTIDDVYDTDSYFNQGNLSQGLFELITFRGRKDVPNALAPQTYGGDQNITAGYISLDHNFSESTKVQVGLRYENIKQSISWSTTLDPTGDTSVLDEVQWLPSLFILHKLNDINNIRFAASSTYTLPQYKEKAFFQFEEVTQVYLGNPALYASTNYNFDIKWEQFPSIGELVSITAFSRIIKNPINDVSISSASNDLSYVNSGDQATVFGVEFELVKDLYSNPIVLDDRTLNRIIRL